MIRYILLLLLFASATVYGVINKSHYYEYTPYVCTIDSIIDRGNWMIFLVSTSEGQKILYSKRIREAEEDSILVSNSDSIMKGGKYLIFISEIFNGESISYSGHELGFATCPIGISLDSVTNVHSSEFIDYGVYGSISSNCNIYGLRAVTREGIRDYMHKNVDPLEYNGTYINKSKTKVIELRNGSLYFFKRVRNDRKKMLANFDVYGCSTIRQVADSLYYVTKPNEFAWENITFNTEYLASNPEINIEIQGVDSLDGYTWAGNAVTLDLFRRVDRTIPLKPTKNGLRIELEPSFHPMEVSFDFTFTSITGEKIVYEFPSAIYTFMPEKKESIWRTAEPDDYGGIELGLKIQDQGIKIDVCLPNLINDLKRSGKSEEILMTIDYWEIKLDNELYVRVSDQPLPLH